MIWTALALSLLISLNPELLSQNKSFWVNQLQNSSVDLRINALQKLKELRYSDTIGAISKSLRDSHPEVRFHAVRALTSIPHPDSRFQLQARFQEESDPYLKSEIRRSLQTINEILAKQAEAEQKNKNKTAP